MLDAQRNTSENGVEPAHNVVYTSPNLTADVMTQPVSPQPTPGYHQSPPSTVMVVPVRRTNDPMLVQNQIKWRTSCIRSGLLQGICGFLSLALGIVSIGLHCQFYDTGLPIWAGFLIIFSASMGVSASRHPSHLCLITMYMIFSFFGIMCGVTLTALYCTAAIMETQTEYDSPYTACVAVDAVLSFVGIIVILSSAWGFAVSSKKAREDDQTDSLVNRRTYYISSVGNTNYGIVNTMNTEDSSPPPYMPYQTDSFQVPGQIAAYGAYGLPPSYQASSEMDKNKAQGNIEH